MPDMHSTIGKMKPVVSTIIYVIASEAKQSPRISNGFRNCNYKNIAFAEGYTEEKARSSQLLNFPLFCEA